MAELWNHNLHYHRLLVERMPVPCNEALDVGCGDGVLTVKLAERARHVTAIDRSRDMIAKAKRRLAGLRNVTLVEDDLLAGTLPKSHFDFIVAVAVIHHMAFDSAVGEMAQLLRRGGMLAILGLATVPQALGGQRQRIICGSRRVFFSTGCSEFGLVRGIRARRLSSRR